MSVNKIATDDAIFSSKSFLRDRVPFNILLALKEQAGAELYSDGANFIIVVSPAKDAIWTWTINDISDKNLEEMWNFIEYLGTDITCPYHVFMKSVLVGRSNMKLKVIRTRLAYQCKELYNVIESHGHIKKADQGDLDTIASLIIQNENTTEEAAKKRAARWLTDYVPFLWLDNGDQAVAMSVFRSSADGYVRLGGLYVRPDCRSMGYERSLIHKMSEQIIADGKTPMIYVTESQKNTSTRYADMGFIKCGRIAEVELA
ncbi:MAG: GNAT family N-acetyltransferase [Lachnospiraceae bacterium]|nr:GNAT family N-acetyltransferase [Lachnospiraceae bacterium]MBP5185247.1 GNAT family N-acetyltransferase [Lachnospiraceae bacterium]